MFRESDEISFSGSEDGSDHDHYREFIEFGYGTSKGSGSGAGVDVKLEEDHKPFQQSTAVGQETGRPGHQPKQKHGRHRDRKRYQPHDQHPYRHKTPPYCDASQRPFQNQHGLPRSYDDRPSSEPKLSPTALLERGIPTRLTNESRRDAQVKVQVEKRSRVALEVTMY